MLQSCVVVIVVWCWDWDWDVREDEDSAYLVVMGWFKTFVKFLGEIFLKIGSMNLDKVIWFYGFVIDFLLFDMD